MELRLPRRISGICALIWSASVGADCGGRAVTIMGAGGADTGGSSAGSLSSCPECVPDPAPLGCMQGQTDYAALARQLVEKSQTLPCTTSSDCTLLGLVNPCASGCQFFSIVSSESGSLLRTLIAAATADCASCPAQPESACSGPIPMCIDAHCSLPSGTSP